MKTHSIYSLIVMLIMTMFVPSCTAESELDKEPEESARYYVKYEVNVQNGWSSKTTHTITFTSEDGPASIVHEVKGFGSIKWEGTYGPFQKGDKVSLSAKNNQMDYHGRIYISREKEPFVIKAEGTGAETLKLQATIDF